MYLFSLILGVEHPLSDYYCNILPVVCQVANHTKLRLHICTNCLAEQRKILEIAEESEMLDDLVKKLTAKLRCILGSVESPPWCHEKSEDHLHVFFKIDTVLFKNPADNCRRGTYPPRPMSLPLCLPPPPRLKLEQNLLYLITQKYLVL